MAFNASECAFEGFRLVRKRPAAFATWCLFYLAFAVVAAAALFAAMAPMFMQFAHPAAVQAAPFGDPALVAALFRNNLPILLAGAAVLIPLVVIWSVMMACAIYRAVLRPYEKGFGYLRLGADEFRIIGLYLQIFVLSLGGWLAVAAGVAVAVNMGVDGRGGVFVFLVLLGALAFLANLFVAVRLSLCAPQTFAERRIDLFGSWRVTRGHFWGLFGMYLLVFVLLICLGLVNGLLQLPFKAVMPQVLHGDMSRLPFLIVGGLVYAILAFVLGMLQVVISAACRAAAYRELAPPKADAPAKAFA